MPSKSCELLLGIETDFDSREHENHKSNTWPLEDNFPIVIDRSGAIISRYKDSIWDLWPWGNKSSKLNFGDKKSRNRPPQISPSNANLLRQITAWLIYGPSPIRTTSTLISRFQLLRKLAIHCTNNNICITDLHKYPAVIDTLVPLVRPSTLDAFVLLLHQLYEQRHELNLYILAPEMIRRLLNGVPKHNRHQTAYIPPRIWQYQISRLREFIDDYQSHEKSICECYLYCIEAYIEKCGSPEIAFSVGRPKGFRGPFHKPRKESRTDLIGYRGTFLSIAEQFGIHELLSKWLLLPGQDFNSQGRGICLLTNYLSLVTAVGVAYTLNFSLMRIEEGWNLKRNCLSIEQDERFGPFFVLTGATTKTIDDSTATWITAPCAKHGIDVLESVAKLRSMCAKLNPHIDIKLIAEELNHLTLRSYEPWTWGRISSDKSHLRLDYPSYANIIKFFPKLFSQSEITITEADLNQARLVNPTLDENKFTIGAAWSFTWHQLRRTGAVNMHASGAVSDASLQYQLKHSSRAMSLYYTRGYSSLKLSESAQKEYIRAMYDVLSRDIRDLLSNRFVSPYGSEHKQRILNLVSQADNKKLVRAASTGVISWHETLLGGCTSTKPCNLGGIDSVIGCAGGNGRAPCPSALYNKNKEPALRRLQTTIDERISTCVPGTPYYDSLLAQQIALAEALNVIVKG